MEPFNSAPLAHISPDGSRSQSIRDHLQGTAALAGQFGSAFGAGEPAALSGLVHDIGKYSAAFQRRLHGSPERVDHATAGAQVAFSLHQPEIAFAVAGHHGGIPDFGSRADTPDSPTLFGRLKRQVEPCDTWKEEIALPSVSEPSGLPDEPFTRMFYTRMLYSCLVDADYLDTEAFMDGCAAPRGGHPAPSELLGKLRAYVSKWDSPKGELNRRRSEILRACFERGASYGKGLYTLTVPTGGGKTVSSLAFALSAVQKHQMSRVIYVIPYTSIIDQNAAVFSEILGAENVLEHHSGADYTVGENATLADYRKALAVENWDAPVVVTTAVQFFESLFSNRSSQCRKLHNLANSILIFDEAQTIPIPCLRPCVAAIAQLVQHYGATAVLCTATQPALGPLFAEAAPDLPMREICPEPEQQYALFRRTVVQDLGELAQDALIARLCASPQTLCVVNRRKTAQALFASLPDDEGSYCLTTLLYPAHRKRLLKEIRSRLSAGLPCRVVSTSLIEAGVDVDFPVAYREEAGLDSILQTAGRCNREGRRSAEDSLVGIFRLEGHKPLRMLEQNIASTRKVLQKYADPAGLDAIEAYFTWNRILKGDEALDQKSILDACRRGVAGSVFPFREIAERFHLIDSPARTVYIPLEEGAQLVEELRQGLRSRSLFRKLGQFGVSVYPDHYAALYAAGCIEELDESAAVLTDTRLYGQQTGLSLDVETGGGFFI